MPRDLLARAALHQIPKILTLQDRNPHSPTYGCFDRAYWHYKIIDFPSGMAQELVWPLALAYALELPDNPFHGRPAVREWVAAGVRFAARSAHPDRRCRARHRGGRFGRAPWLAPLRPVAAAPADEPRQV